MLVGVATVVAAFVRFGLLSLPLERDEGEYAYAGQLLLHGLPPYSLVFNMKFPGTYLMYALFEALFGQTIPAIRIGLILVTSATTVLLYFLAARLLGRVGGVVAATAHAMLALSITAMGPFAHATHFVALFAVAGLLLLLKEKPYLAGVLLALAILMKQPGMTFAIFAAIAVCGPGFSPARRGLKPALHLLAGGVTVGALTAAWLALAGVFKQFWFWTIDYAREYASVTSGSEARELFQDNVSMLLRGAPLVFLIALAGAFILFLDRESRRNALFIGGVVLAGLASVVPGFYFRPHYFLTAMPGIALLCGVAVTGLGRLLRNVWIPAIAFAVAVIAAFGWQSQWLLNTDTTAFMNVANAENPFVEAPSVGEYLRDHTSPDDRIAILGSEPEIYYYANRKSATGYIYAYPLMEHQKFAHQMQLDMIHGIEQTKPKYLLMVSHKNSWLAKADSDRTIFDWYTKTTASGAYALDAFVDDGNWITGSAAQTYRPRTKNVIVVLRRK